ncbi:ABC transporter substrate-binding protein [Bradyrhizobium sp. Gha]|uniref:ABC transporter substrate-binding protein n=1 Tax=Bradyrhizobium sp. Gha TaxID=1855318 RepID=UPI0008ED8AAF|nr:ABC transporter substrate-binding protein [Bradyrhizobium sp. Gha]SFK16744.1 peptide/nickel transport system substrate-binding protein [Bradyrhizobium sp. Gha]
MAFLALSTKLFLSALGMGSFLAGNPCKPAHAATSDRLIAAVQQNPPTLEPMREFSNVAMRIVPNVLETLIDIDYKQGFALVPGLATSWQRVDERTLELKLRRGVKCQDGSDFTAEDVVFTFGPERFLEDKAPGHAVGAILLGNIASVEAVGPYAVKVISKVPDPLLEERLANYPAQVICKRAYQAAANWDAWSRAVIGTGPYRLAEIKPGESITLERFDRYWGEKAPVAKVVFKEVADTSARIAGLLTGEVDIITEVPPDQLKEIEDRERFATVGGPIRTIRMIVYNGGAKNLADRRLRQALNLAIDRQLIVDTVFHGRTRVPHGLQQDFFGKMYIANWPQPAYDPNKARELLKQAGYKGELIHYRMVPDYYTAGVATGRILQQMWKAVGLNVQIDFVENWSQVYKKDDARNIQDTSATAFFPDPASQLWRIFSPNDRYQQEGYWANAEFDRLGQILEQSSDLQARRSAARDMLRILDQDPPGTVLYELPVFYGKRKALVWTAYPCEFMDLRAGNLSLTGALGSNPAQNIP